jgi:hypothetical protein
MAKKGKSQIQLTADRVAAEKKYQELFFTAKGVSFKRIGVSTDGEGWETIRNLDNGKETEIEIWKLKEILSKHSGGSLNKPEPKK